MYDGRAWDAVRTDKSISHIEGPFLAKDAGEALGIMRDRLNPRERKTEIAPRLDPTLEEEHESV